MNTLCRYFRHMVERTFPVAVWWELSSTTTTNQMVIATQISQAESVAVPTRN
jgi:hypothetical protein